MLDEEEDLSTYLPKLLREKGLEVIGLSSITQALERFAKEPFDAVLLDIMMPPAEDMDAEQLDYGRETGVEVARRMRRLRPDVPIVALTVVRDPEIQAKMWEAGIIEIINKPADPEQIAEVLLRSIQRRKDSTG